MKNNLPPFYVGQKVVALVGGFIKKGSEHTVKNIWYGCHCWFIDIGIISPVTKTLVCKFCNSELKLIKGKPLYPDASCFAPITESFQSITLSEVLENETKLIGVN